MEQGLRAGAVAPGGVGEHGQRLPAAPPDVQQLAEVHAPLRAAGIQPHGLAELGERLVVAARLEQRPAAPVAGGGIPWIPRRAARSPAAGIGRGLSLGRIPAAAARSRAAHLLPAGRAGFMRCAGGARLAPAPAPRAEP